MAPRAVVTFPLELAGLGGVILNIGDHLAIESDDNPADALGIKPSPYIKCPLYRSKMLLVIKPALSPSLCFLPFVGIAEIGQHIRFGRCPGTDQTGDVPNGSGEK